jgi:putative transposase
MTNHVHLIGVPQTNDSFSRALKELNMRYAQRLNRTRHWSGHTWQGRYFSAPLDEPYFWAATRYVERNPVRAGIVARAEHYPWSSARAHCEGIWDPVLSTEESWLRQLDRVRDWAAWLAEGERPSEMSTIRGQTGRGLPCGSSEFLKRLESIAGRPLEVRQRGRQRR